LLSGRFPPLICCAGTAFTGALADRSSGKPSHSHVSVRATLFCRSAALQFGTQVFVITDAVELEMMALSPSAFILVRAAFSPPAAFELLTLGCDGSLQELRRRFVFWLQVSYSPVIVFRALRWW
jgi:hypothetical protein